MAVSVAAFDDAEDRPGRHPSRLPPIQPIGSVCRLAYCDQYAEFTADMLRVSIDPAARVVTRLPPDVPASAGEACRIRPRTSVATAATSPRPVPYFFVFSLTRETICPTCPF